jgi:hypothetical protein
LFTFHEHHKQQKNRVAHLTRTQSTHTHKKECKHSRRQETGLTK